MRRDPTPHAIAVFFALSTGTLLAATTAPATQPAAKVYEKIGKLITVEGPSSNIKFTGDFGLYTPQWFEFAEKAYMANAEARAMVRTVPPPPAGRWMDVPSEDQHELNECRHVANDLRDAGLLAMLQGRPNETLDLMDDIDGMNVIIRDQPKEIGGHIRLLVAVGLDSMRCACLMELSPRLRFGDAPDGVPAERIKKLITRLLDQKSGAAEWEAVRPDALAHEVVTASGKKPDLAWSTKESVNRVNGERTFAAMSLACQLYYADQGTWPEEAADLVPAYLPKLPIDPWGDGKQTFGYQLIKGGRPDGADRPMVFSRCQSKDGLEFASTRPLYGYYTDDGSYTTGRRRQLGQFRDVSFWETK